MSVRRVGKGVTQAARDERKKLDRVMRIAVLELTGGLVDETPVLTGTARANWNFSTNQPDTSTYTVPNPVPNDPRMTAYAIKQEANRARVSGGWKASDGTPAYITNAMPYIVPLEEGSSDQRPARWVRRNVRRARTQLRRLARQL